MGLPYAVYPRESGQFSLSAKLPCDPSDEERLEELSQHSGELPNSQLSRCYAVSPVMQKSQTAQDAPQKLSKYVRFHLPDSDVSVSDAAMALEQCDEDLEYV